MSAEANFQRGEFEGLKHIEGTEGTEGTEGLEKHLDFTKIDKINKKLFDITYEANRLRKEASEKGYLWRKEKKAKSGENHEIILAGLHDKLNQLDAQREDFENLIHDTIELAAKFLKSNPDLLEEDPKKFQELVEAALDLGKAEETARAAKEAEAEATAVEKARIEKETQKAKGRLEKALAVMGFGDAMIEGRKYRE